MTNTSQMISSQISPALPHSSTRVEAPSRGDDKINYTAKTGRRKERDEKRPPPEQQSVVDDLNSNVDSDITACVGATAHQSTKSCAPTGIRSPPQP